MHLYPSFHTRFFILCAKEIKGIVFADFRKTKTRTFFLTKIGFKKEIITGRRFERQLETQTAWSNQRSLLGIKII
jgi:hypothetical protein